MTHDSVQAIAAECLSGRVRMLNRIVTGIFDSKFRAFGVRASQYNLLVVIAAHGPLAPTDVCKRLCLEKSTLSRDLDRLIERGLIDATPGPRRSLQLQITTAGEELIQKMSPAWHQAQSEAAAILGQTLTEELYRLVNTGQLAAALK
jgi:DNA-binding MarR family transcriptional regulator